jgi:aldose 1-epimerase
VKSDFGIRRGLWNGVDAVIVSDDATLTSVVIAVQGATLLQWRTGLGGTVADLVDGYRDRSELAGQDGVRGGMMAPFQNRIADAGYLHGGQSHDLLPGAQNRLIYHGFLRLIDLEVHSTEATPGAARLTFGTTEIRPGRFAGYPYAIDIEVSYLISPRRLDLEIAARNVGATPAPYGCGWHPYFALGGGTIDGLVLTVPANQVIQTDDDLIPLAGAQAHVSIADRPDLDFRSGRVLTSSQLDVCFADLDSDRDGRMRTTLTDPASGMTLSVWQERGLMHAYTGDRLARDGRRCIALGPVEFMTDAFNRPEAGATTLPAGESRIFRCGVSVDGRARSQRYRPQPSSVRLRTTSRTGRAVGPAIIAHRVGLRRQPRDAAQSEQCRSRRDPARGIGSGRDQPCATWRAADDRQRAGQLPACVRLDP